MLLKVKGGWDDTDLLREKITSWACLEISGLKLIFHWKSHFVILVKSLFKSFVAFLILGTVANNELSSASFGLTVLGYTEDHQIIIDINKKQKEARIDPCGTPARTSLQDKCWPFRTTLCFRDFKKLVKIFKRGPIPFYSNLWMRPLRLTLSNAFEISKNTLPTS